VPSIDHYISIRQNTPNLPMYSPHCNNEQQKKTRFSLTPRPVPLSCIPSIFSIDEGPTAPDLPSPIRLLVFLRLEIFPKPVWRIRLNYYSCTSTAPKTLIIISLLPILPNQLITHLRVCNTKTGQKDLPPTKTVRPTYNTMFQPASWTNSAADLHQTAIDP
jgi:hypothetical protein